MNRQLIVVSTVIAAIAAFTVGVLVVGRSPNDASPPPTPSVEQSALIRPHSPVVGPAGAPVTIVEFFDPSCEACRAFHPIVKQILARFPSDVRLVLRYTPFHKGSDEAVRILEASRAQGKFETVLEALFEKQSEWALHGAPPDLDRAWAIAGEAGLDLQVARIAAQSSEVEAVLKQDVADLTALSVQQTPTFFVNGKPLPEFGPEQLLALVQAEVDKVRAATR